jgi:hypothetical protein
LRHMDELIFGLHREPPVLGETIDQAIQLFNDALADAVP